MPLQKKHSLEGICVFLLVSSLAVRAEAKDNSKANSSARPSNWAQPIDIPGVPNLHRVSKGLFRSAQPTSDGMKNLEKRLGIKTIINLRLLHSDRDKMEGTDMNYVHIPLKTWKVKKKHVIRFLKIVTNPEKQPVLVHCNHGADRTGVMVAFYRMVIQGWNKHAATDEMTHGGFNYHSIWINLLDLIEDANLDEYRRFFSPPDSK